MSLDRNEELSIAMSSVAKHIVSKLSKAVLVVFALGVMSCGSQPQPKDEVAELPERIESKMSIDTVLEPNHPDSLDMNVHQLYLDTSSNITGGYYFTAEPYWVNIHDLWEDLDTLHQQLGMTDVKLHLDLSGFPVEYVQLRKYKGQYVTYDRCNGSDVALFLTDSVLYYKGVHEIFPYSIIGEISKTQDQRVLQIREWYNPGNPSKIDTVTIQRVSPSVYIVQFGMNDEATKPQNFTPIEHFSDFDRVINHCPTGMVLEYDGFE